METIERMGNRREAILLATVYLAARAINLGVGFAVSSSRRASLSSILSSWNGGWYLQIARHGYPRQILGGSGSSAESALASFRDTQHYSGRFLPWGFRLSPLV